MCWMYTGTMDRKCGMPATWSPTWKTPARPGSSVDHDQPCLSLNTRTNTHTANNARCMTFDVYVHRAVALWLTWYLFTGLVIFTAHTQFWDQIYISEDIRLDESLHQRHTSRHTTILRKTFDISVPWISFLQWVSKSLSYMVQLPSFSHF